MIEISNVSKQEILDALDEEDYKLVEDDDWTSEGKWEQRYIVIEYKNSYYGVLETRSGSYWSDYEYNEPDIWQVTPRQVVKTITVYDEVRGVK